jgi:hypothetical protein
MILLFVLSILFGYIFTAHHKSTIEKLQSQLLEERIEKAKQLELYEFKLNKLKSTIREML